MWIQKPRKIFRLPSWKVNLESQSDNRISWRRLLRPCRRILRNFKMSLDKVEEKDIPRKDHLKHQEMVLARTTVTLTLTPTPTP